MIDSLLRVLPNRLLLWRRVEIETNGLWCKIDVLRIGFILQRRGKNPRRFQLISHKPKFHSGVIYQIVEMSESWGLVFSYFFWLTLPTIRWGRTESLLLVAFFVSHTSANYTASALMATVISAIAIQYHL